MPHCPMQSSKSTRYREYDWMVRNFTVQGEVPELHHENSYASRLYSYMGQKNQVEWLIDRLQKNPTTRSATISLSEPC